MTVIFYGVQGEGLGHACRSKPIIEYLNRNNEVHIFCGGKAYPYLKRYFRNIVEIEYLHIKYKDGRAANFSTFFSNTAKIPSLLKSYSRIKKAASLLKPNLIITDFEPLTNYFGLLNNIPTIAIDNQHAISKADIEYPKKKVLQDWITRLVIKCFVWKAKYCIIPGYFFPKIKEKNCFFVRPIIRKEIQKLKPEKKDFVLVYQTTFTDKNLEKNLMETGENIVVYGFSGDENHGRLRFKSFKEKEFFDDLKNCRAIITNGGQTLICEALFLKKPVFSVPIKNQFEQYLNAFYLQRLGFGEMHEDMDSKKIKEFLRRADSYEKNLKKQKMMGNKELFSFLDRIISIIKKTNIMGKQNKRP